jgi:quercetin dioxygenase-like cupin family protein
VEYQRALRQNWHAHEQPILTLMLAGHVEEAASRETRVVVPLDVGFKPAGIRHADRFDARGVRALRIALDLRCWPRSSRLAADRSIGRGQQGPKL